MVILDTNELISIFRDNGYKVTPQRLAISNYVLTSEDHPSAEQIFHDLKKEHPTISLGTIYKTLALLNKLGLVQELCFDIGSSRYDPDMDLHVNVVCSKCGKINDYKDDKVKDLWDAIISELDVNPTGHRIDVYYDCKDCN